MADQWTNRIEIRSETSSRIYVIAQRVSTGAWECSCPGWKRYRHCKHLETMVPSQLPAAPPRATGESDGSTFRDSAYRHYDPRHGFGSAEEWVRAAEEAAWGRGRYRPTGQPQPSLAADLAQLGLTELPADVKELVAAMRRMAFKTHPDHGGTPEAFTAMFTAYERLLTNYRRNAA